MSEHDTQVGLLDQQCLSMLAQLEQTPGCKLISTYRRKELVVQAFNYCAQIMGTCYLGFNPNYPDEGQVATVQPTTQTTQVPIIATMPSLRTLVS